MEAIKKKILIADDSQLNRELLIDILEGQFDIVEASNGTDAIKILENDKDLALVLLDINMPDGDGFEVLGEMNRTKRIERTPVMIISAQDASTFADRAFNLGVNDYISRPFDAHIVRRRVLNTLMLYEKQKKLLELMEDEIYERQKNNAMLIGIMSHVVEFRNEESGPHIQHVRIISELLLKALGELYPEYAMSNEEISLIGTASALHDLGKISIPSEILNKPGRFTDEEYKVMKTHSAVGAEMLQKLTIYVDEPLVKTAYQICRWHHERFDGRGYPDGLKGDEIPISAQVVSLADVYDALTSERIYKRALPHETAIQMIKNGECGAFNPKLLEVLDKVADTLYSELSREYSAYPEDMRRAAAEVLRNKLTTTKTDSKIDGKADNKADNK